MKESAVGGDLQSLGRRDRGSGGRLLLGLGVKKVEVGGALCRMRAASETLFMESEALATAPTGNLR